MIEIIITELAARLPGCFPRTKAHDVIESVMGKSPFRPRTLANLDSRKEGPGGTLVAGRIMYEKQAFLDWLRAYLEKGGGRGTTHKVREA